MRVGKLSKSGGWFEHMAAALATWDTTQLPFHAAAADRAEAPRWELATAPKGEAPLHALLSDPALLAVLLAAIVGCPSSGPVNGPTRGRNRRPFCATRLDARLGGALADLLEARLADGRP